MQTPPQLFDGAPRNADPTAYVRRRKTKPSRHMTSFELTAAEHSALERLAKKRGVTKAAVLRDALDRVVELELAEESSKAA